MILLIWGTAIIFSICPLIGWSQFVSEVSKWLIYINPIKNAYIKYNDTNIFNMFNFFDYYFQSYLMGCAFDMYSSAWSDRSYGIVLFFYCWIFPLLIIFFSYIGIMYETRSSRNRLIRKEKKKDEEDNEEEKPLNDNNKKRSITSHSPQRVSKWTL